MVLNKRHMVTMKRSCSCSMPGVWRAVAHNEGAAVIFHSPKACGHVTRDMDLGNYYRSVARNEISPYQYTAPLVVSGLLEDHSIFGGAGQLRGCINHVAAWYNPRYIVIANSCVGAVIGDDIQAVADEAEQECHIPVIAVHCNGFLDGEYHVGFCYAAVALAERFMTPQPVMGDTVTLLGDRGGPKGTDVKELRQLLSSFGLRIHCHFPGYATMGGLQRVSSSAFCVLMGGRPQTYFWMRKLACALHERFGTQFFDQDYPVGWQGTKAWITNLGKYLGREDKAALVEKEQEQRLSFQITIVRPKLHAAETVFCIGRPLTHFQPEWVLEFLGQAGVTLVEIVLLSGLTTEQRADMRQELKNYTNVPVKEEQDSELVMKATDIVVTTHELTDDSIKRQLLLPMLPPVGVGGITMLMTKLARLADRSERWGGVIYG